MRIADNAYIDSDEGRITLVVDDERKGLITYDIHSIALEFYENVRRELGPYASEAASARAAVRAGISLEDYTGATVPADPQDSGYALDDPKSPGYHERMVD